MYLCKDHGLNASSLTHRSVPALSYTRGFSPRTRASCLSVTYVASLHAHALPASLVLTTVSLCALHLIPQNYLTYSPFCAAENQLSGICEKPCWDNF